MGSYLIFGRGEGVLLLCVCVCVCVITLPVDHDMHVLLDRVDIQACKVKLS